MNLARESMQTRMARSDKFYKEFVTKASHELFIKMFSSLSMIAINRNMILPVLIDGFVFKTFTHTTGDYHPHRPHWANGEYKKDNIMFKFSIHKSPGIREIISLEFIQDQPQNKTCSCDWDLVKRSGCKCGAITPYKATL